MTKMASYEPRPSAPTCSWKLRASRTRLSQDGSAGSRQLACRAQRSTMEAGRRRAAVPHIQQKRRPVLAPSRVQRVQCSRCQIWPNQTSFCGSDRDFSALLSASVVVRPQCDTEVHGSVRTIHRFVTVCMHSNEHSLGYVREKNRSNS